jgi:hypothetical protein
MQYKMYINIERVIDQHELALLITFLAVPIDDFNVWCVVGCGVWTSHVGLEGTDGDRKRKSCDWSDTKFLAVPIALTLKVKMNCSAILALSI